VITKSNLFSVFCQSDFKSNAFSLVELFVAKTVICKWFLLSCMIRNFQQPKNPKCIGVFVFTS
jgi:hypothetical protein